MMKRFATMFVVWGFAVAGCTAPADNSGVGHGPLTMTKDVAEAYKTYYATLKALYFFVSSDGLTYSYASCDEACKESSWGDMATEALAACHRNSHGVPCHLYARGRRVVWDGPVKVAGEQ